MESNVYQKRRNERGNVRIDENRETEEEMYSRKRGKLEMKCVC